MPLALRRIRVDPAVASAVIVTTATDVFGFLLFLGIASASIDLIATRSARFDQGVEPC